MPYDMTSKVAGNEISSTYEGRHVEMTESLLSHPSHADGLVDKGDPVVVGESVVGVAFRSALVDTDLIAIDTEGIWALSVVAVDNNGNSAVARGDEIFVNRVTCILSKLSSPLYQQPFGVALSGLASGTTGIVAVKVHRETVGAPQIEEIIQTFARAAMTDGGGTSGYIDLTVQLPAGAVPLGWKALCNLGFTGDTSAVVMVGINGDTDRFSADTSGSVFATNALVGSLPIAADGCKSIAAAVAMRLTITSAADFTNVVAGNLTIHVYYMRT